MKRVGLFIIAFLKNKMYNAYKEINMNNKAIPAPDEIWRILKEVSHKQKEVSDSQKELSDSQKELSDSQKKAEKEMRELRASQKELSDSQKETDRQMQKTDKKIRKIIGDSGNRWGKLGENLVKGNLSKRLSERGIKVERAITNLERGDTEFDIIAVNGKEIVVVEVKASLEPYDVSQFARNMEKFKILWPEFKNKTVFGAMAFLIKSSKRAEDLAEKQGFFVISATGDVIIQNEKNFEPRVFS